MEEEHLAAGALALKERILVSPPGRRFSSISFFLSSSPAVRPSVSSLSVTTMLREAEGEEVMVEEVMVEEVMVEVVVEEVVVEEVVVGV